MMAKGGDIEARPDAQRLTKRRRAWSDERRRAIARRDREFLPSAVQVLETPPAPAARYLLLTICALVAAALAWSFVGRLEVHAVAQGKIEAAAGVKIIQPLEAGKVRAIAAQNGERVKAGDLLIEFDPTELQADERDYSDALDAARAELARRRTAIETVRNIKSFDKIPIPTIAWENPAPGEEARLREQAVLQADLDQLSASLDDFDKQIAEKRATIQRLASSIAYEKELVSTLNDRVNLRNLGIKLSIDTKVNLLDAEEALEKSQAALAGDQGQLLEAEATIAKLAAEKQKTASQFIADNESKSEEAERKALDTAQQLAKARAKLARTRLYAPTDGTVQQLAVTTVGQVVTTGQQLMILVPDGGPLQVQIYVSNADIGFVKLGQDAAVKIDSFPFTRYGALHGKVARIASDAIDEQAAHRAEANEANLVNSATMQPSSAPPNFVFPVTIALEESAIRVEGGDIPLTPGMTVTAEIKTDDRRIVDYLFSPLAKVASEALHER